jgi:probable addiction module antidote protein
MVTISRWNILEHLFNEEEIIGYLEAALQDIEEGECDTSFFFVCLADVAKARAINQLTKETGIDRNSLCAMFIDNDTAPLELTRETIVKVARAFSVPVRV